MWIDSTVVSSRPDNLKYVSVFSGFSSGGTMAFEVQGSTSSAGTGLAVYQDSPYVALAASVSIPLNSWVHIAFVRTGTTIYGFVNGQRITLGTSSATIISASGSVAIGRDQNTTYYSYMKGYISNHRVVNGTAVYTANFTPPTTPLTAITNTSLLLNFANAGVYDATAQNNLVTVGSAQTSTTQSKWLPTSISFNGTSDYLDLGSNQAFVMGTENWTVESWVYPTSTNPGHWMFLQGNASAFAAIRIGCQSNQVFLLISANAASWTVQSGLVSTVPLNTWTHLAVTRSGSTVTLYVNGTSVYTSTALSTSSLMTGTYNLVGRIDPTNLQYFTGYIQDLRITKGVALYTANFTAPTLLFLTGNTIGGTRLGDCKGNSNIIFDRAKTVYWNLAAGGNWYATAWALSSGGAVNANNFPLAQDTAIFEATGLNSAATITYNTIYNVGTINTSARTTNTMTLQLFQVMNLYGNWINGTGVSFTGLGYIHNFIGRGNQTITSAGIAFPDSLIINSPGGSVTLQDSFTVARTSVTHTAGTFNTNGYSFSMPVANSYFGSGSNVRAINFGSGSTWTINGSFGLSPINFTTSGTVTINLTSATAKSFSGSNGVYTDITLNQGGAGALSFSGNNTFKDITNTYNVTGATTISLTGTYQTFSQFTASGAAGKVLSITGSSSSSPGTLIITGAAKPNVDYVSILNVRAYPLTDTWSAGSNSVNNGSLGWTFASGTVGKSNFLLLFS
jgi:hypothetical protein